MHKAYLAIKNDGTLWAWGDNTDGELGDGTYNDRDTPVQVVGLTNVIAIAAGGYHNLALKSDGTVWAWGRNFLYQLGDPSVTQSNIPIQVKGPLGVGNLTGIIAISAGGHHSIALKNDNTVIW